MAQPSQENFIRCHAALQTLLSKTLPCLQNTLDLWHHQTTQRLKSCTTPNQCQPNRKPSSKINSCQTCMDWAKAIEAEVYPHSKVGSLQWANVNPTKFGKDPLEVIKLFVLRIPANQVFSTLGDFDAASLLMIMWKFKEFHHGNQAVYDQVLKVFNCLLVYITGGGGIHSVTVLSVCASVGSMMVMIIGYTPQKYPKTSTPRLKIPFFLNYRGCFGQILPKLAPLCIFCHYQIFFKGTIL